MSVVLPRRRSVGLRVQLAAAELEATERNDEGHEETIASRFEDPGTVK